MPWLFAVLLSLAVAPIQAGTPVRSVQQLNIDRYAGTWYEIARFPMFFQRRCQGDTTATYGRLANDCISVINRCRTEDGFNEARGKACTVRGTGNAQLKVSFFWPFRSNYWVIGLDPDYRWAVVGNPNRNYLWILSRTSVLPEEQLNQALKVAAEQGYDLDLLQYTPHTAPTR